MASKNPTNDIASKILLDRGYDPCSKYSENPTFWTSIKACDPGFIPDFTNGYCYIMLPNTKNLQDGDDLCRNNYDGELLLFDTNSEAVGFVTLVNTGIYNSMASGAIQIIRDTFLVYFRPPPPCVIW